MQGQYKKIATETERQLNFSVPQGSVVGPVVYLAYASTLEEVIQKHKKKTLQKSIYKMEQRI